MNPKTKMTRIRGYGGYYYVPVEKYHNKRIIRVWNRLRRYAGIVGRDSINDGLMGDFALRTVVNAMRTNSTISLSLRASKPVRVVNRHSALKANESFARKNAQTNMLDECEDHDTQSAAVQSEHSTNLSLPATYSNAGITYSEHLAHIANAIWRLSTIKPYSEWRSRPRIQCLLAKFGGHRIDQNVMTFSRLYYRTNASFTPQTYHKRLAAILAGLSVLVLVSYAFGVFDALWGIL